MTLSWHDKLEIRELVARYDHAIDSGDPEGWAATFTEDGSWNGGVLVSGQAELLAFARGLPENPALVCFLDDLNQNYYDLTCNLARTVDPAPTAIFTYNDWNAVAVMRALIDLGYRVPHVSVVGYDNVESSGYPHPPLNSLPQQAYQIGQVGTEKLIEPIHWSVDQPWSEHHVFFNPELLVRASTSPGLLMDLIMPVVGQTQVGS